MRTFIKFVFFTGLVMIAVFTSCKKTEIKGEKGDTGAPGAAATTLITSKQFTVTSWHQEGKCWKSNITFPAITQGVLDSGTVSVDQLEGYHWEPLPRTVNDFVTSYEYSHESLTIVVRSVSGTLNFQMSSGSWVYKAVVIAK